jgi:plastocyanin
VLHSKARRLVRRRHRSIDWSRTRSYGRAVRLALCALLLLVIGCGGGGDGRCATPRTATPIDPATTGAITGTVTFEGTPPGMEALRLTGECASSHPGSVPAGDLIVHDGHVANVFVYVSDGLGDRTFAVPSNPVTIDQKGCLYEPRVVAAVTCQPIRFVNSDAFLHNVHGTPTQSRAWNFGMSVRGSERTVKIDHPEVMVEVRCDVHPWMHAYIGVLDHPYSAVTGPDGRFALNGLPPGDYVVRAWHERLGTRESRVSIAPKEAKDVAFAYGAGR